MLIVGRGRLGRSLARVLRARGVALTQWAGRGRWPAMPDVDVALLAVADPFLEEVASRLAPRLAPECVVIHASGARGIEALHALRPRARAVMHPLVSFVGVGPSLEGAFAVVAGDRAAMGRTRWLARALGLTTIEAAIHGARYHAAAALVANGAAALATRAVGAIEKQGVSRRCAERAVAGLLRSVADNVASVGVPRALTGPIVRGDARTVRAHRAAMDLRTRAAYDAIAPVILDVAREAGLSREKARAIRAALLTRASSRARPRSRRG